MRVSQAGSSYVNEGTVTCRVEGGGDTFDALFPANGDFNEASGSSQSGKVTVPAGTTLFIIDWYCSNRDSTSGGLVVEFELVVYTNNEDWSRRYKRSIAEQSLRGNGTSASVRQFNGAIAIPERSDVEFILSRTSGNNARPVTAATALFVEDGSLAGFGDGTY
jgi:hypothetical protein